MGEASATFDPGCRRCAAPGGFPRRDPRASPRLSLPARGAVRRSPRIGSWSSASHPGCTAPTARGRPFTGDHAGILLYQTLHAHGFASLPVSVSADDGLHLVDCRITNAVKCVPPANKPLPAEVQRCNHFLAAELAAVPQGSVIVALGAIAHGAVLRALGLKPGAARFAHAAEHELPRRRLLLDSYHCSRYNTQTRRLTAPMFDAGLRPARATCSRDDSRDTMGRSSRLRRQGLRRHAAHAAGRLPDARGGRRDPLRRQGAQPQGAGRQLFPARPAAAQGAGAGAR